jgi:hypothetical protein
MIAQVRFPEHTSSAPPFITLPAREIDLGLAGEFGAVCAKAMAATAMANTIDITK